MRIRPFLAIRRRLPGVTIVPLLAAQFAVAPVSADPTVGFLEEWPGTSLQGWGGGLGLVYSNPGTGGFLGAGDGFLLVSRESAGNLGTVSFGAEYFGDWIAAGVTQIRLWLNDVNAAQPLEIHVGVGSGTNNWQYNQGFVPPHDRWAEFVVDLTSAGAFTQIIGPGTFEQALRTADRLRMRHDRAPFGFGPPPIAGDFGLDHLLLTNPLAAAPPGHPGAGIPVELATPFPNPSRGPVTLAVRTHDHGPVRVEIVDVGGRTVRRAVLPAAAPGPRTWLWDGRDEAGRPLPPGAYRARAVGEAGGTSRPLVRIR